MFEAIERRWCGIYCFLFVTKASRISMVRGKGKYVRGESVPRERHEKWFNNKKKLGRGFRIKRKKKKKRSGRSFPSFSLSLSVCRSYDKKKNKLELFLSLTLCGHETVKIFL